MFYSFHINIIFSKWIYNFNISNAFFLKISLSYRNNKYYLENSFEWSSVVLFDDLLAKVFLCWCRSWIGFAHRYGNDRMEGRIEWKVTNRKEKSILNFFSRDFTFFWLESLIDSNIHIKIQIVTCQKRRKKKAEFCTIQVELQQISNARSIDRPKLFQIRFNKNIAQIAVHLYLKCCIQL